MNKPKTERNRLIVKLINDGWTYEKVKREMRFRSKATVHEIYMRDKDKFSV